MSLINNMLRDLDARRAPAADRAQMQDVVHAAQKRPARFRPGFALVVVGIAAAAGGAWYWLAGKSPLTPALPQPASQASPVPQLAPAVAPSLAAAGSAPAPQTSVVAPARAVPATSPATATPPAAVAQAKNFSPIDGARKAREPQAGASTSRHAAVAVPPAAVASTAAVAAKALPASSAEPSIDKHTHTPLANEAAENEYNKAIAALRRGAMPEAIASLQLTLRLDTLHIAARQALLSLFMRQQQWGEAQTLAEEGLVLDPAQTGWAIALARMQMENGRLPEATETLARHAGNAGRNADYQAFHALLLQKQKRYHEACDRYIAAVTLRPGEARWWYGLGVSLEADERPQEAHEAFVKAKDAGNLPPELAGSLKFHLH